MVIVWRLSGNIIRTALCRIVWHNVHNQQHTYNTSSSYSSNRLGLSHWDPYTVRRGSCLELYYCNMVEWFWWDSSLISTTNWFRSVLWHCWFGHLACKNRSCNVSSGMLRLYTTTSIDKSRCCVVGVTLLAGGVLIVVISVGDRSVCGWCSGKVVRYCRCRRRHCWSRQVTFWPVNLQLYFLMSDAVFILSMTTKTMTRMTKTYLNYRRRD